MMVLISLGIMWLARLLLFGAYGLSIILAYRGGGLILAFVVAIPFLGQLLWFGMFWQAVGFWNPYTILVLCGIGCYGLAILLLQPTKA